MTCHISTWIHPDETLIDPWGGSVQLIETAANLGSVLVTVQTPWGDEDSYIQINKGASKTYTDGAKTYIVKCYTISTNPSYPYAKFELCYEFVEKVDTSVTMILEAPAEIVEGSKIILDITLKDANNNILDNFDVKIYKNGVYEWYVPGDWRYEHVVTADEIGETLVFQGKFEGSDGFNPSESALVTVGIPGKLDTTISMGFSPTSAMVGETIQLTGILRDSNNEPVPNQTVKLYHKISGVYQPVMDSGGFPLLASTNASGEYYRPWEPTSDYIGSLTYTMRFEGSDGFNACESYANVIVISAYCPIPTIDSIDKT